MAQVPQNAGTGDYVKAPEQYQREMPIGEQLVQLKDTVKGNINQFADQANIHYDQASNDPANPASDDRLARDLDTTAQHAATSVETAKGQVARAVDAAAQTAQSMKGAFVATKNQGTATPTSPNLPQQPPAAPAAQSVSESLGQTAATVTDAVKNFFTPRQTTPGTQPGMDNITTNMPQDVPRSAPQ
ncbi:hypothetical protein KC19_12G062900 [Ceratodon purpureus]|uniref:Uncharacterized protein n=1 Tax=Ceratodon purpureus TaxID=3225 RepID=A0A8T0G4C9_CERPU|nr:hypothetical protein KC19_12G062900 [Ceratodon purpureus]